MNEITTTDSELLNNFFKTVGPVSDELFAEIIKCFEKKTYRKGESILKAGEVETKVKLIVKGIVHQYVYDGDIQVTIDLKSKGLSFYSLKSYLGNSPSYEIQEAVTDVELLQIDKKDMEELSKINNQFGYLLVKIYECTLVDRENHHFIIKSKSPGKRFKLFYETIGRSKPLLEYSPDKYIASYLNMTPQQFSKEKRKLKSKEKINA